MNIFQKIKSKKENWKKKNRKESKLKELENAKGVNFAGYISKEELGNELVNGCSYEASYDMPEIINHLRITEDDALIDIGCGKGYAMHYFSQLPFGKIDGIEYNEQLAIIAKENIKKIYGNDKRFSIICGDVCQFTEYDQYNYIYLYNPLNSKGIEYVVNNLNESLKRKPRNMYIIYQNPRFWETFTRDGVFEKVVVADMCLIMKHMNN